jgi:hypothetical protein
VPVFIDELNEVLATGEITYDEAGIAQLFDKVAEKLGTDESIQVVLDTYIPEMRDWLQKSI